MTDDERRNSEQEAADQYSRALRNPPPAEALDYMRDRLADARRERWEAAMRDTQLGHAVGDIRVQDAVTNGMAMADQENARLRAEVERLRVEREVLAQMFAGLERFLATSARDWGDYRVDAWLYAVLIGWDCEEDDPCDGAAMREVAQRHGWDDATVAKARRYRDAVRRVRTQAAEGSQP